MVAAGVLMTDVTVAGPRGPVPTRHYAPPAGVAAASGAPIVWVHGGAFVKGGLDQRETHEVAAALAGEGFRVVTVGYRLTTRAQVRRVRYPMPLDDVVAVVRSVQAENPDGVILGGASAGACLSAATVLRIAGEAPLRGVFFAYGTFHAVLPVASAKLLSAVRGIRRYTHRPTLIGLMNLNYAGSRSAMREAFAFPGGHDLSGFPPSLLVDAESDMMRASGSAFARELGEAGVPVEYHVMDGASHAFLHRPRDPAFPRGLRLIADWAKRL